MPLFGIVIADSAFICAIVVVVGGGGSSSSSSSGGGGGSSSSSSDGGVGSGGGGGISSTCCYVFRNILRLTAMTFLRILTDRFLKKLRVNVFVVY